MKRLKKLTGIMLTAIMLLSLAAAPSFALTWTDAHGNEIELDETLEAYAEVALQGADDAARKGETNLGDLWTDALRWFAESGRINDSFEEDDVTAGNNAVAVDAAHIVALWNGGNLRADVAEGKFGAEQLAEVLPYPNKVAVVYMTGAQLQEALEAASQALPYSEASAAGCASFMQVAGLKYTLDLSRAYDAGEVYKEPWYRAASVGRAEITEVNGQAFDAAATYAVITSNANFNGMDSSYVFKEAAAENEKSTITTAVVRDVVWQYIDEVLENIVGAAYAEPQGRITITGAPEAKPAVQLSSQKLSVDGAEQAAEVYNIDGFNFFMLRDMAALLNGTKAQFSVSYDEETRTVVIVTGEGYDAAQPDDPAAGTDKSDTAVRSGQRIQVDGAEIDDMTVYNIGGNNFFKLQELGEKLGFGVAYDAETRTMLVTSE